MTDHKCPKTDPVPEAEVLLADPATPEWVKAAITAALTKDPIDAANSAEILYRCLDARCRAILPDGGSA